MYVVNNGLFRVVPLNQQSEQTAAVEPSVCIFHPPTRSEPIIRLKSVDMEICLVI